MNRKIKKKMKLARVATMSFSIVSQLRKQLEEIKNQNIDITIISGRDDGMEFINKLDIPHKDINIPRDISLIKDFLALINLYLCFRREDFDIVHSTTPKAGLLTSIAGFFARVPIRIHTFTGQAWANLSGFKRWICIKMDKVIITLNTQVYADSFSQVEFLLEQKVIKNLEDIKVLGDGSLAGVDVQRFSEKEKLFREERRVEFNIPNESFVFIYLGRINLEKGVNELIEAFNKLTKENRNAYLILVGPIDIKEPTEKIRIESLIQDSPNIRFYEYTDNPERFLSISDVLCCPSYREGFGTVIIEAAAMGITSIGSDVVGLKDSIINKETGLLFRSGDSEDLREKMQLLMDNHELRRSLNDNAKKNALNRFSSSRLSNLVIDEYKEKYGNK